MEPQVLNVLELKEQLRDEQIEQLVHQFYRRIQDEPELGPVFASRIADDEWPAHLNKMVRFWSTILRGTNRYTGNPMVVHSTVPTIRKHHFARWLELFREVADEVMPGPLADSILQRAHRMGDALTHALAL